MFADCFFCFKCIIVQFIDMIFWKSYTLLVENKTYRCWDSAYFSTHQMHFLLWTCKLPPYSNIHLTLLYTSASMMTWSNDRFSQVCLDDGTATAQQQPSCPGNRKFTDWPPEAKAFAISIPPGKKRLKSCLLSEGGIRVKFFSVFLWKCCLQNGMQQEQVANRVLIQTSTG